MQRKAIAILALLSLTFTVYSQKKEQKPAEDQPIRISTELVQVDVVVTDKDGRVVRDLTKDDFELVESGKKQSISFFEFVDASKKTKAVSDKAVPAAPQTEELSEADVRRIFAFVIDDLTIRNEDLFYVREMLSNYVNHQMGETDLVAIVRTVGGKGLLQQFTSNKQLLMRAIASFGLASHPLSSAQSPLRSDVSGRETRLEGSLNPAFNASALADSGEITIVEDNTEELMNSLDDTIQMTRARMTLGTASFVIESMKQLPGRKSLVLVSGGMPILNTQITGAGVDISGLINRLTDRATRAGVAVHTMDIRGLSANPGVAGFEDTPGKSALATDLGSLVGAPPVGFGRRPDESLLGRGGAQDQLGLRAIAAATGGIAVLNKNNFTEGIDKILGTSEGYYLLAYTPLDANFDGKFRKIEIKLKRGGLKVYNRKGYFAKEEAKAEKTLTKEQQLLAAIRSPLARRDVGVQAIMTYKATEPKQGAIDIHLLIDPKTLKLEEAESKRQTSFDVAGFVFDEFGEMRGGFSETINATLSSEEFNRASRGGLTYSANTKLPAGAYQVRIAVRDNKTGGTGTVSRYLEVPDLTKGRFASSSLIISAAKPGDTTTNETSIIVADRQISRARDIRYVAAIYNAKLKDGKSQVRAQMSISQNGKTLYTDPDDTVKEASGGQLIKMGQLGLSRVKPGRYTITLTITDPLTDKKYQTITRTADFVVVD